MDQDLCKVNYKEEKSHFQKRKWKHCYSASLWPPAGRENTDRMCQNFHGFSLSTVLLCSSSQVASQPASLLGFVALLLPPPPSSSSQLKLSQNHFGIEWNIEIIPAGRWYHLSSLILDWNLQFAGNQNIKDCEIWMTCILWSRAEGRMGVWNINLSRRLMSLFCLKPGQYSYRHPSTEIGCQC